MSDHRDDEKQPAETWAKERETPLWVFAAAKAMQRWPEGFELTREDFDAACDAAQAEVIR